MKQCPECGTVQARLTPFCENCGFRLRNTATAVEGVSAITPEMLQRVKETRTLADELSEPGQVPARAQNETDIQPKHHTNPETPAAPKTVMGDLAAVPFEQVSTSPAPKEDLARNSISSIIMERPTEGSALIQAPQAMVAPQVGANKLVLFSGVWAAMTIFGVLMTFFLITEHQDAQRQKEVVSATSSMIDIPGGTLLQGLDESSRSFILQVCIKISDEPDDECEQKKLLRGEFPQKEVSVAPFAIDNTEVTTASYQACVDAGKCEAIDYKSCKVYTPKGLQISLRVPGALRKPNHPAVCVARAQAAAFCAYRSGALPSHHQWEYAARGDDGVLFPWGETWAPRRANWGEFDLVKSAVSGDIDRFAWTAPPGQYPKGKSPFGVLDMAGNVAEWVEGDQRLGDVRGGSWVSDPFSLRTTVKKQIVATAKRTDVGFRCIYPKTNP